MGSPLSPIVANVFMENFEKKALDTNLNFGLDLWMTPVLIGLMEKMNLKTF